MNKISEIKIKHKKLNDTDYKSSNNLTPNEKLDKVLYTIASNKETKSIWTDTDVHVIINQPHEVIPFSENKANNAKA